MDRRIVMVKLVSVVLLVLGFWGRVGRTDVPGILSGDRGVSGAVLDWNGGICGRDYVADLDG